MLHDFFESLAGLADEDETEAPEHLFEPKDLREVVQADRQPAEEQVLDLTGLSVLSGLVCRVLCKFSSG